MRPCSRPPNAVDPAVPIANSYSPPRTAFGSNVGVRELREVSAASRRLAAVAYAGPLRGDGPMRCALTAGSLVHLIDSRGSNEAARVRHLYRRCGSCMVESSASQRLTMLTIGWLFLGSEGSVQVIIDAFRSAFSTNTLPPYIVDVQQLP